MADKSQLVSNMNTRQKVTAGLVGLIVLFILYEVWGMFGGSGHKAPTSPPSAFNRPAMPLPPKPTVMNEVPAPAPQTPQDLATMQMQQDAQQRYLKALNELQMLRITQSIAEANQAIMSAKLNTVGNEKKIVDLLTGPAQPPPNYAQGLVNPAEMNNPKPANIVPEVAYTLVSVTQTREVWSAVVGANGTLYHVRVGDILPADGSTVVSISPTAITLEKDGVRRRVSIVPII